MEDQLVTFETAKLAKEKAFDERITNYFQIGVISKGVQEHTLLVPQKITSLFPNEALWARPTQSLLQRWLRDVHNIYITVQPVIFTGDREPSYFAPVLNNTTINTRWKFDSWEKALEEGLMESLKLIK